MSTIIVELTLLKKIVRRSNIFFIKKRKKEGFHDRILTLKSEDFAEDLHMYKFQNEISINDNMAGNNLYRYA